MKRIYEIWREGYMVTGDHGLATKIGESGGESFDEAVELYITIHPEAGIEPIEREDFMSQDYYENRRSNWAIWGCKLFDNERDARKAFG